MQQERNIIVIGHKNPDTDSICSAIAYAHLKNMTTHSHHYVPMRAGEISQETMYVLDRFNMPVPDYLGDIGAQVCDMEIRRTPGASKDMTIKQAWDFMAETDAVTLSVTEEDRVIGLITKGDIAQTFMEADDSRFLSRMKPRYRDIADTVNGTIVVGDGDDRFEEGKVLVGAAMVERMQEHIEPGD